MTVKELRKKHPSLHYQAYHYRLSGKDLSIQFDFLLEGEIHFQPKVVIKQLTPAALAKFQQPASLARLEQLIFNLGLAEIPSYWKAACSPLINITAGELNPEQLDWWNDLIINGQGEFFYQNQIDFTGDGFLRLQAEGKKHQHTQAETKLTQAGTQLAQAEIPVTHAKTLEAKNHAKRYLLPIGGGKDSALTLGIFDKFNQSQKNDQGQAGDELGATKKMSADHRAKIDHQASTLPYGCLLLEPQSPAAQKVVAASDYQHSIIAKRTIDARLLELNQAGYLNGHTPFSAYLAFLSTLIAYLFDYSDILVANERSANEANVTYLGHQINHQYSKTFGFEEKFRAYLATYMTNASAATARRDTTAEHDKINYLSFLRPLYELQIAQLLAHYPKYHPLIRSCNVGQQNNRWCCHCPKCLFVFTILYPFIKETVLVEKMFGANLFAKTSLVETALELVGQQANPSKQNKPGGKPFECVGTYEETLIAFYLSIKKYRQQQKVAPPGNQPTAKALPPVLQAIQEQVLQHEGNLDQRAERLLTAWNEQHHLPAQLEKLLKDELAKK